MCCRDTSIPVVEFADVFDKDLRFIFELLHEAARPVIWQYNLQPRSA